MLYPINFSISAASHTKGTFILENLTVNIVKFITNSAFYYPA